MQEAIDHSRGLYAAEIRSRILNPTQLESVPLYLWKPATEQKMAIIAECQYGNKVQPAYAICHTCDIFLRIFALTNEAVHHCCQPKGIT